MIRIVLALAMAAVAAAPASDPLVTAVAAELDDVRWGETVESWRERHPAARVESYRGRGFTLHKDEYWAYEGESAHGWLHFYTPPTLGAPTTRMWRFSYALENQVPGRQEGFDAAFERMLTDRFGPVERPEKVSAFNAGAWQQIRRWRDARVEVLLYVLPRSGEGDADVVRLEGRDATWVRSQNGDYLTAVPTADARAGMDEELRRAAGEAWPAEAALLDRGWPNTTEAGVRAALAIEKLLTIARKSRGERGALALVVANQLGQALNDWIYTLRNHGAVFDAKVDWAKVHRRVVASGAGFRWPAPEEGWSFESGPLRTAWQRYPGTRWGEWAFVTLLDDGWTTGDAGRLLSPTTISRGEAFLAKHPRSPYRTRVAFIVGEAYEGWWSLGQTRASHVRAQLDGAKPGGDRARREAIRYYQGVAAAVPGSAYAEYVSWRLPRLKLGVDTDCIAGLMLGH